MRLHLYSVYDRLMGVYLAPFPARGDAEARRQILNTLADPRSASTPLVQSPQDYEVHYLATLDDETGEIFPVERAGHVSGKPVRLFAVVEVAREVSPSTGTKTSDQIGDC